MFLVVALSTLIGYAINDAEINMAIESCEHIEDLKLSMQSAIATPIDSPQVELIYPIVDPLTPLEQNTGSNINLEDPLNLENKIEYDPVTGQYYLNTMYGKYNYHQGVGMTWEEFQKYSLQQSIQENWMENISVNNSGGGYSNKPAIPALSIKDSKVGSFLGDKIEIKPSGSAELIFALNTSRTANPQIPEKQRKITIFDFNQRIQINLLGNIGDKMKLNFNYNTEATFDFENQIKLEYKGNEDEIIQSVEAGNVSLPLSSTLITGAQSLFGVKIGTKWGKLTNTTVFSQNKGKRTEMEIRGGAQVQNFEITADNYEANKHYFLGHYFRNNFDKAMQSLPVVNSGINITRVEVWVTNTNNTVDNTRNFVAFADLGEVSNLQTTTPGPTGISPITLPQNDANNLYGFVSTNSAVRGFVNAASVLSSITVTPGPFSQGVNFEKVQNARLLSQNEFTVNTALGYISLNSPLNNDEVLGVAFQYTYQGQTYQVGEFSTDGVAGQNALVLKLLKGTITNPRFTRWDLMMKNIYNLSAYQLSKENFRLDVWYNNPQSSIDINYLPYTGVDGKPLIQVVDMDRYDQNANPYADGLFDFMPLTAAGNKFNGGGTINPSNGRVIFTTVEPFGTTLKNKMVAAGLPTSVINAVVYQPLYDSTKTAAQQIPTLNRFKLKGQYQSAVGAEISLNAINIPQGSVIVTAGGVPLVENQDYRVDYNLGRVTILNQSYLESQTPIKVSVESNTLFSMQTKTMMGSRFDYKYSRYLTFGGTIMNLTERPLTQKINIGDEPISNTMIEADVNFKKEVPWITRVVDKIPFINTKEKSNLTASFEAAKIIPGTARAINGLSYIDDFEGSQSAIDLRSQNSWVLASIPRGQPDLFPEADVSATDSLQAGYNRAKLAWYVIDPLFHLNNNLTPDYIKNSPMQSNQLMRVVYENDVFPNRQLATGQPTNIAMFDLAYYPEERGPYNYVTSGNTNAFGLSSTGSLLNPETRWAGIMRPLTTTDFEQANIQYIQFWLMDPFNSDAMDLLGSTGGDLYFNLGNISEDILPDSRKAFENGIPANGDIAAAISGNQLTTSPWGYVPTIQPIVNAFDNSGEDAARINQDVGFDGLSDANEQSFFAAYRSAVSSIVTDPDALAGIQDDPSNDNYHYYRGDDYDAIQNTILERYKLYNGQEGNSPTTNMAAAQNADGYPTSATTLPNVEDINFDNNLSETESYFQYKVSIRPSDMTTVGQNHITNIVTAYNTLQNGTSPEIKWYQFRIPIREPDRIVNSIQDFRSIRFIRVFVKGHEKPIVLRMARLELIRGEWRPYLQPLLEPGEAIEGDPSRTLFDVSAVNIEEHGSRQPINYVIPPGINRQVDVTTANLRNLNEQALSMDICGLEDGDARACYRNVSFDIRSYKRLKMFVHAETSSLVDACKDDDAVLFVRLGTDFEENYYEYELPLKMTAWGASSADEVWPTSNDIDIEFDKLIDFKLLRNELVAQGLLSTTQTYESSSVFANRIVRIKGNPNLQGLKTIMVGVRNPRKSGPSPYKPDDGKSKCLEVWINELRLTDFDQKGGWAAVGRVNTNLADFGNLALSGSYSTPYWGSIEKKVSERQREEIISFDAISSFELGKFFPDKWGIRLPLFMNYGANISNPMFDQLNPDIPYRESEKIITDPDSKKEFKKANQNFTRRRSINFANVKKDRTGDKKAHFWDVENWSLTYAYNEIFHRDINVEYNMNKTYRGGLNYTFNKNAKPWEPFAKNKFISKSKWFGLIKDFNLYLAPKTIAFRNELSRSYLENKIRSNYGAIAFPNYTKNFFWVRGYDVKYDITKNLKFDYSATNNGIVGEPTGRVDKLYREEYQVFKDSVTNSIRQAGITTHFNHTINLTYQLPLAKLPITDWITVNTKYSAGYDWQRSPFGQDTLGHTIQNSRNVSLNGQLNFVTLYNKIPFLKKINNKASGSGSKKPVNVKGQSPGADKNKGTTADTTGKKKPVDEEKFTFVENVFRVLMGIKNASVTFSTTDGIMLPGYGERTQFVGMNPNWSAPGFGFVLGKQNRDIFGNPNSWGDRDEYAFYAADNDWLIRNPNLNKQYITNHAKNFQSKLTIEPLGGLKIDLNADKNFSENTASFFRYIDTLPDLTPINDYQLQNPMVSGVYSMSIFTWTTAFVRDDKETYSNKVFEALRSNRELASALLAGANPNSTGSSTEAGYLDGYGSTQQDVIITSFIAAYTGKEVSEKFSNPFKLMPNPNWRVTFDPMAKTKMKFFKKYFRSLTLNHGYRSTLNIGNYATNLQAQVDSDGFLVARDIAGNFINNKQINAITIAEQFSPLFGMDIKWKMSEKDQRGLITKLEIKRDRNIALSLTNNQITEVRSKEIVIGTGYTFPKLKLPFKIAGKNPESDLDARADVSIRDNVTVTRKIVENYNQPTSGQLLVSIKTSITYTVAQNVQIRAFFDKTVTDPKISNSFRTSNANSGLAIRLTLQ